MPLPGNFQFSQSNLQDYSDCARRFELRYIDQLRWPAAEAEPVEQREKHLLLGQNFHHMLHQYLSGIPANAIEDTVSDDNLLGWWRSYIASRFNPAHPKTLLPPVRIPEVTLACSLGGFRLVAKFDLLAIEPGKRALIIDWKTAQHPPSANSLEQRLQTLVYRYLLAEAGAEFNEGNAIEPEQVEMVYWFTNFPDDPRHIAYDSGQHQASRERLESLIMEIGRRKQFDLTSETRLCRYCVYRSLCERGVAAGNLDELENQDADFDPFDLDFDFDQIAEIEF